MIGAGRFRGQATVTGKDTRWSGRPVTTLTHGAATGPTNQIKATAVRHSELLPDPATKARKEPAGAQGGR